MTWITSQVTLRRIRHRFLPHHLNRKLQMTPRSKMKHQAVKVLKAARLRNPNTKRILSLAAKIHKPLVHLLKRLRTIRKSFPRANHLLSDISRVIVPNESSCPVYVLNWLGLFKSQFVSMHPSAYGTPDKGEDGGKPFPRRLDDGGKSQAHARSRAVAE